MDAADTVVGVVDREGDAVEIGRPEPSRADATLVGGGLEDVLAADPSVLVAVGETALSAVARAGVDIPVLPVGSIAGIESVDCDRLPAALGTVLDGGAVRRSRPVLGVGVASGRGTARDEGGLDDRERALFDVMLVTDEPARISEYGVHSRSESVATFRADGVVAATPAGSHGYASAVDAPFLSRAVGAVAVAPIAPFVTRTRRWVLPDDDLGLTVERNESAVTLVVDGRSVGTVTVDDRVSVAVAGTLTTLVVPEA
jgi:NAD+ kinase